MSRKQARSRRKATADEGGDPFEAAVRRDPDEVGALLATLTGAERAKVTDLAERARLRAAGLAMDLAL